MPLRRIGPAAAASAGLALGLALATGAGADDHRQLGAHVHGHGTLDMAFEGGRVTLDLEAPGMDILGFEHAAQSEADKAALAAATARLRDPLALFKIPAAAGCKVAEAKVELGHDADDGDKDTADAHHDGHHDGHGEHGPYDTVGGEYELSCASLAGLTSIEFDYFKVFPSANSLTVNIVTPRAQSTFEVSRDKPVLDLGKLM